MKDRATIAAEIHAHLASGRLVAFNVPGTDLSMMGEKDHLDKCMSELMEMSKLKRDRIMKSVRKAIKRTAPKIASSAATQTEADALATDCLIYLAHELVWGDGEKLLRKPPEKLELPEEN